MKLTRTEGKRAVSVRFIVEGSVYLLAAREAVSLSRRLRLRGIALAQFGPPGDAIAAAVLIEVALDQPAPRAIEFTRGEASEIVEVVGDKRERALYRALRRSIGRD
jgi:hypothetical protein